MIEIHEMQKEVHENAIAHGWWEPDENGQVRTFGDLVALCHCELSEAVEAYRDGHVDVWYGQDGKPEGVPTELADCVIRIMDMFGYYGWDLEKCLEEKTKYNEGRPYKHGGKVM